MVLSWSIWILYTVWKCQKGPKVWKPWWKNGRSLDSQPWMVVPLKMSVNMVLSPILNNPAVNEHLLLIYIYAHNTNFRFNHVFFCVNFPHLLGCSLLNFQNPPRLCAQQRSPHWHRWRSRQGTTPPTAHLDRMAWIKPWPISMKSISKILVVVGRIHIQTWMLDIF
jgi:hypothetical protein